MLKLTDKFHWDAEWWLTSLDERGWCCGSRENSPHQTVKQFCQETTAAISEGYHASGGSPWLGENSPALNLTCSLPATGKETSFMNDLQIPKIQRTGVSIWSLTRQVKHLYRTFCICLKTKKLNLWILLGIQIKEEISFPRSQLLE